MPLQANDVEIWPLKLVTIRDRDGKPLAAYEIKFRVKGVTEDVLWIPQSSYTPQGAEREVLSRAEDIIALSDRYPVRG